MQTIRTAPEELLDSIWLVKTPFVSALTGNELVRDLYSKMLRSKTLAGLEAAGVRTVGDVSRHTWKQLVDIPSSGSKTACQLLLVLERGGISLRDGPISEVRVGETTVSLALVWDGGHALENMARTGAAFGRTGPRAFTRKQLSVTYASVERRPFGTDKGENHWVTVAFDGAKRIVESIKNAEPETDRKAANVARPTEPAAVKRRAPKMSVLLLRQQEEYWGARLRSEPSNDYAAALFAEYHDAVVEQLWTRALDALDKPALKTFYVAALGPLRVTDEGKTDTWMRAVGEAEHIRETIGISVEQLVSNRSESRSEINAASTNRPTMPFEAKAFEDIDEVLATAGENLRASAHTLS